MEIYLCGALKETATPKSSSARSLTILEEQQRGKEETETVVIESNNRDLFRVR